MLYCSIIARVWRNLKLGHCDKMSERQKFLQYHFISNLYQYIQQTV
jgi:hypothetical protein